MITTILPNMIPMRDIKLISDGDRVFYELGYKINSNKIEYENNWIRTGKFKEILELRDWMENDIFLNELDYLEHHNFMIIKKGT